MVQNYELYYILKSTLDSEGLEKANNYIMNSLETDLSAKNIQIENQGSRKLAYPINKSQTGIYVLVTFDLDLEDGYKIATLEGKLNYNQEIVRFLLINQTDFLKQKNKEKLTETEFSTFQDLNKGKKKKECIFRHLGLRDVDYKDVDFLNQFTSPYAKIFGRTRTGVSAKFQRKLTTAIKRARHMALMPFTPKYMD